MRSDIWETWLKYYNKGFQIQNRQVLLLVDNAPSHTSPITNENNINESDSDTNSIQESSKSSNK
jgi:DDE superfamily endonuclease